MKIRKILTGFMTICLMVAMGIAFMTTDCEAATKSWTKNQITSLDVSKCPKNIYIDKDASCKVIGNEKYK